MCVPVNSSNVRSNRVSLTCGGPESDKVTTAATGVPRVIVNAPTIANATSVTATKTSPIRFNRDISVVPPNTLRATSSSVLVTATLWRHV